MVRKCYAVRDTVAGVFAGGLHLHAGDPAAIRMFGDVASDRNTMIGLHPNDFELCCVGQFDESTGNLVGCEPVTVITGAAWRAAQQAQEASANA